MRRNPTFQMLKAATEAGAEGYILARQRGVEGIIAADGLWVVLEDNRYTPSKMYLNSEGRTMLVDLEEQTLENTERLLSVDPQG